jgi:hypothetical protein
MTDEQHQQRAWLQPAGCSAGLHKTWQNLCAAYGGPRNGCWLAMCTLTISGGNIFEYFNTNIHYSPPPQHAYCTSTLLPEEHITLLGGALRGTLSCCMWSAGPSLTRGAHGVDTCMAGNVRVQHYHLENLPDGSLESIWAQQAASHATPCVLHVCLIALIYHTQGAEFCNTMPAIKCSQRYAGIKIACSQPAIPTARTAAGPASWWP